MSVFSSSYVFIPLKADRISSGDISFFGVSDEDELDGDGSDGDGSDGDELDGDGSDGDEPDAGASCVTAQARDTDKPNIKKDGKPVKSVGVHDSGIKPSNWLVLPIKLTDTAKSSAIPTQQASKSENVEHVWERACQASNDFI